MENSLFSESCCAPNPKAIRMCNTACEEKEQERDGRNERELWDQIGGSLFDLTRKFGRLLRSNGDFEGGLGLRGIRLNFGRSLEAWCPLG